MAQARECEEERGAGAVRRERKRVEMGMSFSG
jgi:hypothetical protein